MLSRLLSESGKIPGSQLVGRGPELLPLPVSPCAMNGGHENAELLSDCGNGEPGFVRSSCALPKTWSSLRGEKRDSETHFFDESEKTQPKNGLEALNGTVTHAVAPSEKDHANGPLEKRLWAVAAFALLDG